MRAARNGIELGQRPGFTFLRPHLEPGSRGVVRNQQAEVWNFVCTSCGYLEWAVYDPSALAFIEQTWMPVPVQPPPPPPPGP